MHGMCWGLALAWLGCVLIGFAVVLASADSNLNAKIAEKEIELNAMANPANLSHSPKVEEIKERIVMGLKEFGIIDETSRYTLSCVRTPNSTTSNHKLALTFGEGTNHNVKRCLLRLVFNTVTLSRIDTEQSFNAGQQELSWQKIAYLCDRKLVLGGGIVDKLSPPCQLLLAMLQNRDLFDIMIEWTEKADLLIRTSPPCTQSTPETIPDEMEKLELFYWITIPREGKLFKNIINKAQKKCNLDSKPRKPIDLPKEDGQRDLVLNPSSSTNPIDLTEENEANAELGWLELG
ncbi:hypothetical protein NEHOM01_0845 [Nematocida homosporus]|uniref:uncharacterized protein n=1 Tax=Nematocida homosporus TaxID=1912981 RepID=UPI002220F3EE|nr:uncharacterized protein NEHOM01_0845 [Nematocida homosporus]KAI5185486.1 hypothetical protein NEHOM01_0845 [Nematocida homosporus]